MDTINRNVTGRKAAERPTTFSDDPLLSERETAKEMRISVATLRRLHKDGKGPPRTQTSDRRFGYFRSNVRKHLLRNTEAAE
jgi:hypothetical protein